MRDDDPEMQRRLREELDRVRPLYTQPRYLTVRARPLIWRLAPAVLASAVVVILGLSAYAGSPNPVVWSEDVVNVVHPTEVSPTPEESPPQHGESPEPSEKPDQHESPEPTGSPEQHEGDDHTGTEASDSGAPERS